MWSKRNECTHARKSVHVRLAGVRSNPTTKRAIHFLPPRKSKSRLHASLISLLLTMSGANPDETAFPRGGHRAPAAAPSTTDAATKKRNTDFLFGNKPVDDTDGHKKKKRRKQSIANGPTTSLLPVGGGGVVQPHSQKKEAQIEALSFSKLAKGTKLLGIVKEVHEDYAIVSLPNLLNGYILKRDVCIDCVNLIVYVFMRMIYLLMCLFLSFYYTEGPVCSGRFTECWPSLGGRGSESFYRIHSRWRWKDSETYSSIGSTKWSQ